MRDEGEILQAVVDAATRLLRADGAMIDLIGVPELTGAVDPARTTTQIRGNRPLLERDRRSSPRPACPGLAIASRPGRGHRRLPDRRPLRAHPGARRVRAQRRHPLGHRGAAPPARRRPRRDHRLRRPARRLRRDRRGGPRRPGRPGRRGHRHGPSHRPARALARRDRPPGRGGADPARDRRPRVGHPRPGRRPGAHRHRGGPASSARTARASTCGTRTWAPCAGRTPRATRCATCPTGVAPAASARARRWPVWPSPSRPR